jgi:hypothetical protein
MTSKHKQQKPGCEDSPTRQAALLQPIFIGMNSGFTHGSNGCRTRVSATLINDWFITPLLNLEPWPLNHRSMATGSDTSGIAKVSERARRLAYHRPGPIHACSQLREMNTEKWQLSQAFPAPQRKGAQPKGTKKKSGC